MTSSPKSTDGIRSFAPSLSIGGAAVLGVGLVLRAYHWNVAPSTIVLIVGWLGLLATALTLWKSMLAVSGDASEARATAILTEGHLGDLEREKKALLRSIKDVEFDRDMGKMGPEDSAQIIRVYRARAIEIIKELDAVVSVPVADGPVGDVIERELAARLGKRKQADDAASAAKAEVDAEVVAGKVAGKVAAAAGSTCASCDTANDPDAAFCKKCGDKLGAAS